MFDGFSPSHPLRASRISNRPQLLGQESKTLIGILSSVFLLPDFPIVLFLRDFALVIRVAGHTRHLVFHEFLIPGIFYRLCLDYFHFFWSDSGFRPSLSQPTQGNRTLHPSYTLCGLWHFERPKLVDHEILEVQLL